MCKSMQTASPLSDSCARNEKYYWAGDNYCASLCPELPMFGGNTENSRLLARRVQQGTCLCLKDEPIVYEMHLRESDVVTEDRVRL